MTKAFNASLICVSLALFGCGKTAGHTESDSHGKDEEEHGDEHHSDTTAVHIDRSMLRDLRITTRPAESRPAGEAVTVLGELRVQDDAYAEVGSPISARVTTVFVNPGDIVKANQPLAELESPEVARVRAEVAGTKARLQLAEQATARRRALAADRIVPERELQATEAELAAAAADQRAASDAVGALGALRGSGAKGILVSPIPGTVIDRRAVRGRMTDAEETLFIVGDLQRVWVVGHAFERDALRMRTGSSARVSFPALPGASFTGKVELIGSRVDPSSRTLEVRVAIENPDGVLRPGMSATATVAVGDTTAMTVAVPVEAIQRCAEGWCVFVPTKAAGVFDARMVGRGRDLGNEVEVLTGLRAGETVVVDGAFLLKAELGKNATAHEH